MATINGLTAEAMQEIRDAVITGAEVVGDDLILTRYDAAEINAGDVRGPTGSPGVTEGELDAFVALNNPVGTIVEYVNPTPPTGWLAMIGQTITDGQTLYPALWAVLPASWKSGANMVFPDARKRVSVAYDSSDTAFDAIGETGGASTHTLTQAELPAAPVTVNPPVTGVTGNTGGQSVDHTHGLPYLDSGANTPSGASSINRIAPYNTGPRDQTLGSSTDHSHSAGSLVVDIAQFNSGNMGSGAAHNNMQPYIVFQRIIKAV